MSRLLTPRLVIGAALVLAMLLAAIAAPLIAPYNPGDQDLLATLAPAAWQAGGSAAHWLGTDSLGRDVLSRLIYGARAAMIVALAAATGAALLGSVLALASGYVGGWVDWCIGRTVDVWMSFPPVILSLILMTGLGTGLGNVILAIILVDWTRFCRVLRAEVLVVARRDHAAAARLLGFTHLRTVLLEVFPAVLPLLFTLFALEMGIAVVVEAILSFVGLGVGPDQIAWGQMIADGRQAVFEAPWNLLAPVLAIFATVAGCNLAGDGLRRALDLDTSRA